MENTAIAKISGVMNTTQDRKPWIVGNRNVHTKIIVVRNNRNGKPIVFKPCGFPVISITIKDVINIEPVVMELKFKSTPPIVKTDSTIPIEAPPYTSLGKNIVPRDIDEDIRIKYIANLQWINAVTGNTINRTQANTTGRPTITALTSASA